MLCKPSSRRQTLQRRLARPRAGGVKSCADSKQFRSCKTLRQHICSPDKSLTESDKSSTKFAVRYDGTQQYSITALTDSSGMIKERCAYDAYGNLSIFDASGTARTSTAEGNRYTYTGREWDNVLDLYHYRARMYDPLSGRFCSRDPIGYEGSPWNLYEYVNGQPTTNVDPTGEAVPILVVGCVIACAAVPVSYIIGAIGCAGSDDGNGPGAFGRCMRIFAEGLQSNTCANVVSFGAIQACMVCIFKKVAKPANQTGLADDIAKGYGKSREV
ncbi:tRNA3(Ser)-specific nuclease WapA precursor [Stieleria neptunia]|uniref:tRNA3(Ser)-specific nuclease WapA n=1 Tax=Stieleria neptunia TaxID=2527979 RepID=A0A518HW45_9BACT|nr:RHS repeat-associated core domain-containing protein [Stieleria neptunia]QDV45072.1 tRNA3(Ser)-specific nuclease WapA precursor [Stieleria neptunia]